MRQHAFSIACLFACASAHPAHACDADPERAMAALAAFVSGGWHGAGRFADGRATAADASFRPVAGGRWLAYAHVDRPPGRYRADGLLGYARSGELLMTLHDGGGGARLFAGTGWCDGRAVLDKRLDLADPTHATGPVDRERFVFERIAGDRLKMTYLRGTADGGWRRVDFVEFDRGGTE